MEGTPFPIVIAEDDEEDRMLVREAFEACRLANPLFFVGSGVELLAYLRREGEYAEPDHAPRPGLILLDLNMPKMGGMEALTEIKADPQLRGIPVVVLTTSGVEEEIARSYDLGVSSYIRKPADFPQLVDAVRSLSRYWFQLVELPPATPFDEE